MSVTAEPGGCWGTTDELRQLVNKLGPIDDNDDNGDDNLPLAHLCGIRTASLSRRLLSYQTLNPATPSLSATVVAAAKHNPTAAAHAELIAAADDLRRRMDADLLGQDRDRQQILKITPGGYGKFRQS